jgi:iron-sulfur cluster assembly accessory protein
MERDLIPIVSDNAAEKGQPPIDVTAAAARELKRVMADKGLEDMGLRVFVTGGGCSGLQYGMGFQSEEHAEPDDIVFESEGIQVFVDPVSVNYLAGALVDFDDSLMGGGFRINNPNAVHSCGCGSSFRTSQSRAGLPDVPEREGAAGVACCSE